MHRLRIALLISLPAAPLGGHAAPSATLALKVTRNGYLDGPGVSVMLYNDTYSPFSSTRRMRPCRSLHGHRITTNGDEHTVDAAAARILEGNAANAIVGQAAAHPRLED